ncbi:protein Skeletor, isoforms B/C [Nasonia vitripennis]|uniref:Protein Skeletor n=1 Tax=Nasonia vitripennis TaxID=7425 RepID=A0A7M7G7N9_NASVI|nr:protein Skeletor, isoforms B/C [Nasonia vitripennis]
MAAGLITCRWSPRPALLLLLLLVAILGAFGSVNADEVKEYSGKYLGKLNVYHHQVAGDVYAVDEYTLLLTSFSYDGTGADTFFWAGGSNRPGPQGFIVPDEYGITNTLGKYLNKDLTLKLPDNKKITDIKWFAVYDLSTQSTFGDVYIPEEFDPPAPQRLAQLSKLSTANVSSDVIVVLDAKTISIPQLSYDGTSQDAYFCVGQGKPSPQGTKVPDENGYLDPIRAYKNEDVIIQLPGEKTIFDIGWISIYDVKSRTNLASILVPSGLNVPPSLVKTIKVPTNLPNCVQMHKRLQVAWEIFPPQITVQLIGQIPDNGYMAFGVSGSDSRSQMEGADVTIAYNDGTRGFANDYNVSAKAPCVKVLGQYKGVCKDELVGGQDSNQLFASTRDNGITTVTYRRTLISPDSGDKEFLIDKPMYFIWALGRLDENKEPNFHDYYPKSNFLLHLDLKDEKNNAVKQRTCVGFTANSDELREPWAKEEIFDRSIRTFRATVGPSGGRRGYQAITGHSSNGLAWYINGRLAPELYLRRGLTYNFRVYGGNNPHSPNLYHPLIITDEPHGGYDRLSDVAQSKVRVLAGVEFTRRGRPRPTAVGPLCLSKHNDRDRRLDDNFPTFNKFNRTLISSCEPGDAGILEVTPNSTWPDIVYYNSFTHANMGWKIHVVDAYIKSDAVSMGLAGSILLSAILSILAA